MEAKRCPECALIHPDSAQRCECGYDFRSGSARAVRRHDEREGARWHEEPLVVFALLVFCGPLGLTLLWTNRRLSDRVKLLGTAGWLAMLAIGLAIRLRM